MVVIEDDSTNDSLPVESTKTKQGGTGAADAGAVAVSDEDEGDDEVDEDEKVMPEGTKSLGYGWANSVFSDGYKNKVLQVSGKMCVLMEILKAAKSQGHKTLVFSQYQTTLDVVQVRSKADLSTRRREAWARGGEAQRAEAAARHFGRSKRRKIRRVCLGSDIFGSPLSRVYKLPM